MIDKVKNINELIDEYIRFANRQTRKMTLDDVKDRLKDLNVKVGSSSNVVKTLIKELNMEIHIDPNLMEQIALIERKMMTETNEAKAHIKRLDIIMDNIEEDCKRKWTDYYKENYMNLLGTLSVLAKIINDGELVNIKYNISRLRSKWPINKGDINELKNLMAKAHNKIKKLEMDEEVESFLINITNQDVRIGVSDNVLDWLRKTGAEDYIMLKMVN